MYDFFIAHAGADADVAEDLYDLLVDRADVFLDTRCLVLGDRWDDVVPQAQRDSRVTIVILSPHTESAFYQREEVAAAVELARTEEHRVVPVFLEGALEQGGVPYGLRRIHYADLSAGYTLQAVADELLGARRSARAQPEAGNDLDWQPYFGEVRVAPHRLEPDAPLSPREGDAFLEVTASRTRLEYRDGEYFYLSLAADPPLRDGRSIHFRGSRNNLSLLFPSEARAAEAEKALSMAREVELGTRALAVVAFAAMVGTGANRIRKLFRSRKAPEESSSN